MIFGAFWPLMVIVTVIGFGIGYIYGWISTIIHDKRNYNGTNKKR